MSTGLECAVAAGLWVPWGLVVGTPGDRVCSLWVYCFLLLCSLNHVQYCHMCVCVVCVHACVCRSKSGLKAYVARGACFAFFQTEFTPKVPPALHTLLARKSD